MSLIDYNTFVANVQDGHLQLLATFAAGVRVREPEANTSRIGELRQQCLDLYNAELLSRVAEGYERTTDGMTWHTFDGYVVESANGYVNKLARERVALSREPVPAPPPPAPPPA